MDLYLESDIRTEEIKLLKVTDESLKEADEELSGKNINNVTLKLSTYSRM